MDYREATDQLMARTTLEELAAELGVSVQTMKQARLAPTAAGHRSPPPGWEAAVARVARRHGAALAALADQLDPPAHP